MVRPAAVPPAVNNDIYDTLGDRWYRADDDPVALLRAESRLRNPWVLGELHAAFAGRACDVLDIGCGGGFLSNALAKAGHRVVGMDMSDPALEVAARYDTTGTVRYQNGDATKLPFAAATFDAVCAMDLLEHVEAPRALVAEAARVLKPGGVLFFHTFDRNVLSWLIVIKGVELFVANTPKHMHVLRLFVRPKELVAWLAEEGLVTTALRGSRPIFDRELFRMLRTGRVSDRFAFRFTRSTLMGYTGSARKQG